MTPERASDDAADLAWMRRLCVTGAAQRLRLAALRSLSDIAGTIGTSPEVVSRWERALGNPHQGDQALAYARILRQLETESNRARAEAGKLPSLTIVHQPTPIYEGARLVGFDKRPDQPL
jgi:transcriptional regulator with XRE-family HTH domain